MIFEISMGGVLGSLVTMLCLGCGSKKETPKPTLPEFEPFSPYGGLCDELPEHPWSWETKWECPKCSDSATKKFAGYVGDHQPPFCPKRGGHFHFKCCCCGYEWAMQTYDRLEKKSKKPEPIGAPTVPSPPAQDS